MEVLPHFSHVHPLVFNDGRSHESEEVYCCACGELVSSPRFSCVDCGFHLDKNCAEAPVEMNHPFHRQHNLKLMTSSPYVEACHEEVNMACGSYNCSKCKFIIHVNCALEDAEWYYKISKDDSDKLLNAMLEVGTMNPSFSVRNMIKVGEKMINMEIEHFSHQHNLVLSDEVKERRKKQILGIVHQDPFVLNPNCIFICSGCGELSSRFAYKCEVYLCKDHLCVRCAGTAFSCMSRGHEHLLLFYRTFLGGYCNACGGSTGYYA
ncbi:hypothetical protein Golax_022290, partial [Gossypium laxum]|nr:hypothetical protein [Gossypium laxum]